MSLAAIRQRLGRRSWTPMFVTSGEMRALLAVAEAADLIHAHGPGKPMRMPDDCPLCAALRDLGVES